MTKEYETYEEYWKEVQSTAYIRLNELVAENDGEVPSPSTVAADVVEGSHMVAYYPRTILYYTELGAYGYGRERYIDNREFEDPHNMIGAVARATWFNEIQSAVERILEIREDLGGVRTLTEDDTPIWAEGVTFEYDYEKGLIDPEIVTYTLECISEGEWRMIDPDGTAFEVISPRVMADTDDPVPERMFKTKLDNICAKREHEREKENNDE